MKGGESIRSNLLVIFLILLSLLLGGCARNKSYDGFYQALEPSVRAESSLDSSLASGNVITDVSYKYVDKKNLKLDIYTPLNEPNSLSPTLVIIQGENWTNASKEISSSLEPIISQLRENGYTIISAEYRFASESTKYPDPVTDVKDVLRWVYKNSSKYEIDTNNLGILGISSGAHLAMLAAYSDRDAFKGSEALYKYSSSVSYVVDFFGPTDLYTFSNSIEDTLLKNNIRYLMGPMFEDETSLKEASPVYHIKTSSPKTLIIHGLKDSAIPVAQSKELYLKAKELNADFQLITLKSKEHNFSDASAIELLNLLRQVFEFVGEDTYRYDY